MATAKKSTSPFPLLVSMLVTLGMLIFTIYAFKAGQVTLMYIGLAGVLMGFVVSAAVWHNWNTMKTWPSRIGKSVGTNWDKIFGAVLGVLIFGAAIYLLVLISTSLAGNEKLHRPIGSVSSAPTVSVAPASIQRDTITITKAWSEWEMVPNFGDLNSGKIRPGFDYEIQTASGRIYQILDGKPFVKMEDSDRYRYRIMETASTESEELEIIRITR